MKWDQISIRIAEHDDQAAFRELYNYFFPGLLSFAQSFLKSKDQAEEVVSDVFVRLWQNRSILPTIKSPSYYLYVATRHGCINMLKKEQRFNTLSIDQAGETHHFNFTDTRNDLVRRENLAHIAHVINNLPPKCRLVFRLIKEEGLKYKEVAGLLELSEKTVEAHMTLAMQKIVEQLKLNLPEFKSYFLRRGKTGQ